MDKKLIEKTMTISLISSIMLAYGIVFAIGIIIYSVFTSNQLSLKIGIISCIICIILIVITIFVYMHLCRKIDEIEHNTATNTYIEER